MATEIKVNSGGPSLGIILFVTFLVLKLTHVIDWSWWWVTAPLWGGFALFLLIFVFWFTIYILTTKTRRRR